MTKSLLSTLLGLCFGIGFASNNIQAGDSPSGGKPVFSATLEQQPSATNVAPTPAPATTNSASSEDIAPTLDNRHKLVPGDQVSFHVLEDRDPPSAVEKLILVSDSGDIDAPYIGTVSVSGKTCQQAAEEIKKLLEKDYYYKATVVIGLASAGKSTGRVYIWGEVKQQGALEMPANETLTVSKAILRAGGFGDFAKKSKVKLIRNSNGEKKTFELNMEDILERGHIEKDMTLEPDDFIWVDKRAINF